MKEAKKLQRGQIQKTVAVQPKHGRPEDQLPPNQILFVQEIPEEIDEAKLKALFMQYPGFKEVRTVPGKKDIGKKDNPG